MNKDVNIGDLFSYNEDKHIFVIIVYKDDYKIKAKWNDNDIIEYNSLYGFVNESWHHYPIKVIK